MNYRIEIPTNRLIDMSHPLYPVWDKFIEQAGRSLVKVESNFEGQVCITNDQMFASGLTAIARGELQKFLKMVEMSDD